MRLWSGRLGFDRLAWLGLVQSVAPRAGAARVSLPRNQVQGPGVRGLAGQCLAGQCLALAPGGLAPEMAGRVCWPSVLTCGVVRAGSSAG